LLSFQQEALDGASKATTVTFVVNVLLFLSKVSDQFSLLLALLIPCLLFFVNRCLLLFGLVRLL
jgi:hypothetical protein